jgi:hypothetical protein
MGHVVIKKNLTRIVVLVAMGIAFGMFYFSKEVTDTGANEARWVFKMFGGKYFNKVLNNIDENDAIYILSLQEGASDQPGLARFISATKCSPADRECAKKLYAGANLLSDKGSRASALALIKEADSYSSSGECPIFSEATKIRLFLSLMSNDPNSARKAKAALAEIKKFAKTSGNKLNSDSCMKLVNLKPELFHEYAILLSKLMVLAEGKQAVGGIYIQSINKETH